MIRKGHPRLGKVTGIRLGNKHNPNVGGCWCGGGGGGNKPKVCAHPAPGEGGGVIGLNRAFNYFNRIAHNIHFDLNSGLVTGADESACTVR